MAKQKCSVFDEGLDAPCVVSATMVRTVVQECHFPTCAYYCAEHGDAHGAVVVEIAQKIRRLWERALRAKNEPLINACERALLGHELSIDECVAAIAEGAAR